MQYKIKYCLTAILILILIAWNEIYVQAEEKVDKTEPLAVVVVIDTSGSMSSTDPNNFRNTAADIFIDLLSPEDYLGILTFDTKVTTVQSIAQVQDFENKAVLKDNLKPYIVTTGDTNYDEALKEAANQLNQIRDENVKKAILFITDGKPDPDPARKYDTEFMDSYMQTLWGTVDNLASSKYPVYSIGFSEDIRPDILEQISTTTGGEFQILDNSGSLTSSLFYTLGNLKNRTNFIDKTMELSDASDYQFSIDQFTSQITIVILGDNDVKHEVELDNPNGTLSKEIGNIQINKGYSIVTIYNREAVANGTWKLNIKGKGKVQVLGNMDMTGASKQAENILPTLTHDFFIKTEGYRTGEKVGITSSLNSNGAKLTKNNALVIDTYYLFISNSDGTSEKIQLYDDGKKSHNDITSDDGIWSNMVNFRQEAVSEASIYASGFYKNESFTVEEKIGSYKVFPPGKINISFAAASNGNYYYGTKGDTLSIPVKFENNSDFTEYLDLSLEGDIGTLQQLKLALLPGEIKEYPVKISIDRNISANGSVYDIAIGFLPEHPLTTINTKGLSAKVEVNSKFDYFVRDIKSAVEDIKSPFIVIIAAVLLFILLGYLFYYVFYQKWKSVKGILTYYMKNQDHPTKANEVFSLPGLNKEKLIISFNPDNPNADFYIEGTRYDYDLIISSNYNASKLPPIDGWKAAFQKTLPDSYTVNTTIPGIIEKDGQVFTSMKLKDNAEFETGGYIFRYSMPGHKSKIRTKMCDEEQSK